MANNSDTSFFEMLQKKMANLLEAPKEPVLNPVEEIGITTFMCAQEHGQPYSWLNQQHRNIFVPKQDDMYTYMGVRNHGQPYLPKGVDTVASTHAHSVSVLDIAAINGALSNSRLCSVPEPGASAALSDTPKEGHYVISHMAVGEHGQPYFIKDGKDEQLQMMIADAKRRNAEWSLPRGVDTTASRPLQDIYGQDL